MIVEYCSPTSINMFIALLDNVTFEWLIAIVLYLFELYVHISCY